MYYILRVITLFADFPRSIEVCSSESYAKLTENLTQIYMWAVFNLTFLLRKKLKLCFKVHVSVTSD